MEVIVLWVVGSFGVAWLARTRRGQRAPAFFVLSLLLSPLLGVVFALLAKDLRQVQHDEAERSDAESHHRILVDTLCAGAPPAVADALASLVDMRARGEIDECEFHARKRALLGLDTDRG